MLAFEVTKEQRLRTNAQVHEVIAAVAGFIKNVFQHCLRTLAEPCGGVEITYLVDFVGNVSQHDLYDSEYDAS